MVIIDLMQQQYARHALMNKGIRCKEKEERRKEKGARDPYALVPLLNLTRHHDMTGDLI